MSPMVRVVSAIVVLVFFVGIWASGAEVRVSWLRFYSLAVLVATTCLWVWDRWVWRQDLIQAHLPVPRDIRGTWEGTLVSFWKDPTTGDTPPIKNVYLVVRQSASRVSTVLLTDDSRSRSTLATISEADGQAELAYLYLNRPETSVEHRSRMHFGSAVMDITGRPATRLKGRYWTNRDTKGEVDFGQRRKSRAEDYAQAKDLFEGS